MKLPVFSRLILAAIIVAVPAACFAGFDLSKLDSRIDLTLDNSSMADAVYAVAQASGVDIAAPAGQKDSLTASLSNETLREALNTLSKMSGLTWHIENTVVLFKKPAIAPEPKPEAKKTITPDEGMTSMLASLDERQFFYVSRGVPLPYLELTPAQQEIIAAMLGPSSVGRIDSSTVMPSMPDPRQMSVTFRVMPMLVVPKTSGGEGWTLRLDSLPYIALTGKGAE